MGIARFATLSDGSYLAPLATANAMMSAWPAISAP